MKYFDCNKKFCYLYYFKKKFAVISKNIIRKIARLKQKMASLKLKKRVDFFYYYLYYKTYFIKAFLLFSIYSILKLI